MIVHALKIQYILIKTEFLKQMGTKHAILASLLAVVILQYQSCYQFCINKFKKSFNSKIHQKLASLKVKVQGF